MAADYSPAPAGAPDTENAVAIVVVPDDLAGLRFDAALARMYPAHSRSRLQTWIKAGRFTVDGEVADVRRKMFGGEAVALLRAVTAASPMTSAAGDDEIDDVDSLDDLSAPLAPAVDRPEAMALNVVFEDDDLLVIDKPAGLVVHPGSGNRSGTLLNGLLHHCPALVEVPRAGIVHRLDKDTGGLMVVAKTLTAQTSLVRQLQARTVTRLYAALALGTIDHDGRIDAPIGRHRTQRTKMAVLRPGTPGAREARTHYRVVEHFARATLLECRLETGRTHQIRVHLASIGHPLAGDPAYGKTRSGDARLDAFARQALHARQLGLIHPARGDAMEWTSPLPDDFAALLDDLRNNDE